MLTIEEVKILKLKIEIRETITQILDLVSNSDELEEILESLKGCL